MQIPGGDLAPARRRRYGGGYGRRRRRRSVLVAVAVLAALGLTAWFLTHDQPRQAHQAASRSCPSATPSPTAAALPQPSQVRLTLLNGTSRNGLAKSVKAELQARGFVVLDAANAPAALPGATRVAYGPGGLAAATVVSRHVLGSVTVSDPVARAGTVEVTLGSSYQRLALPAELATAEPLPVASPSPTPCV